MSLAAALVLLFVSGPAMPQLFTSFEEGELLPAEQAFSFWAAPDGNSGILARWQIADGYYMYRDKIKFHLQEDKFNATTADYPAGHIKDDAVFGKVEVYTGSFETRIEITGPQGEFVLVSAGQGCNEPVGVCYPPITHKTSFTKSDDGILLATFVPQAAAAGIFSQKQDENTPLQSPATSQNQDNSVPDLRALLSNAFSQPEFLDVDKAFMLRDVGITENAVTGTFEIAQGYYLYQEKLVLKLDEQPLEITTSQPPEQYDDPTFGTTGIYRTGFDFVAARLLQSRAGPVNITVQYQGCAEGKICYPPVTRTFNTIAPAAAAPMPRPAIPAEENSASLSVILPVAFIAGILLVFTPCVLPMIPVLSSIIVGQGGTITRLRAGSLSLAYVLGTVLTYALMGALAGATGEQLQAYFQNVWAIGILSGVFVAMALSMFGLYELQMPVFLQTVIQKKSDNLVGSIPMVFLLGLVSALVIGACVSPVLISVLSAAVISSDPVLGAQTMSAMALGMGIPLIIIGLGAGYLIPKSGPWMETIKQVFGIMLIAVAIYLLEALPQIPILLVWGAFLIIVGIYIPAMMRQQSSGGGHYFSKGAGIILLVWGICALIGGFMGQRDLLRPLPSSLLSGGSNTVSENEGKTVFTQIMTTDELDQYIAEASSVSRNIIVDYYADWCPDCKKMEKYTFRNEAVMSQINNRFIALQVDVTDPLSQHANALKKRFNVLGPPAMIFLDSSGRVMSEFNFYGYKNPNAFQAHLQSIPN